MTFNADLADMAASIDAALAEPATWSGIAGEVRVEFVEEDQDIGYGDGRVIGRARTLSVHRSCVPEPAPGDVCVLIESGRMLRVIADSTPVLDQDGYWMCQVETVQP